MAVPNVLLATGIQFSSTSYTLNVQLDSDVAQELTFTPTADRNYWVTGDGQADADGGLGGVGDLLAAIESVIEQHTAITSATVSLNTTTWRVEISHVSSGTNLQINWGSSTFDPVILGFEAPTSGPSASLTAPNAPQGLFRPGAPFTVDGRNRQAVTGGVARSLSGRVRVSRFATPSRTRQVEFGLLDQGVVLEEYASSGNAPLTFEAEWIRGMSLGRPIRVYDDETVITSSSYDLYRTMSLEEPYERDPRYRVRWMGKLELSEVT